jgi:hypothetical protein
MLFENAHQQDCFIVGINLAGYFVAAATSKAIEI